jgi:type I restriction enzyme S subunit
VGGDGVMAKLGEICAFQSGGTPSKNKPEYFGGEIPWISTTALNGGKINEADAVAWITPKAIRESAAKIVPANSIMIGTRVGIGKVAINTVEMSTSQDVISLINIDEDKWYKPYLCKLLLSKKDYFNSQARGATIKGIKIDVVANIDVPEIDYTTQRKVAATLNKIDTLIFLRKQQLAKLDELVKARFVEMFGDEQAFNKEPLSQNVEEMFIGPFGSSLKNENFVSKENGYCMVYEQKHAIRKTMDVETRYIDKPKYEELKRFSIHGGDIIVSCRGTIGETYIVPLNAPLGIMHPSIMKIRVKDSIYNRVFFDFLLQEKLKQHEAQANGSGVKMAVTASALGKEEFIVPSIPFQNQFAAFVERVDQQKQTVQQSLEKLELMKKALMQEYFG